MKPIEPEIRKAKPPRAALVFYYNDYSGYVEMFDIDMKGRMINPHPITMREARSIKERLEDDCPKQIRDKPAFLSVEGIVPPNLLHFETSLDGYVIWYTPAQKTPLYFGDHTSIPSGEGYVPALVWKANKQYLYVYALTGAEKPCADTPLYYAPFFNTSPDGRVCMGNVNIFFHDNYLEGFMEKWEQYFFRSRFTHAAQGHSPVTVNLIQLWQQQVATDRKFPVNVLKPMRITLKQILPCKHSKKSTTCTPRLQTQYTPLL